MELPNWMRLWANSNFAVSGIVFIQLFLTWARIHLKDRETEFHWPTGAFLRLLPSEQHLILLYKANDHLVS